MNSEKIANLISLLDNDKQGAMMASEFVSAINSFSNNPEGFTEVLSKCSIEQQKLFFRISLVWVVKMNYFKEHNYFDLRNEYSVKTGSDLYEMLKYEIPSLITEDDLSIIRNTGNGFKDDLFKDSELPFDVCFVQYVSQSHRTLQQSFASYVFEWLNMLPYEINSRIFELVREFSMYHYKFAKTPMI